LLSSFNLFFSRADFPRKGKFIPDFRKFQNVTRALWSKNLGHYSGKLFEELKEELLVADLCAGEFQSKMDWVTNIIETALTEKQRIAILSFLDGKTYREIGEILNISVRAAWELVNGNKNHQGGAIRKIKRQLR
jgi:hypothetical protein